MSNNQEGNTNTDNKPIVEEEVSVLDILLSLARNKSILIYCVIGSVVLGVVYSVLSPVEYTSTSQVVREAGEDTPRLPGGLSSLGGSFGISLGGTGSGLSIQAFPEVLRSREVRLGVVRDTFQFPETDRAMTYTQYVNRPPTTLDLVLDYTVRLPWTLKADLGVLIGGTSVPAGTTTVDASAVPSEEEDNALEAVDRAISTSIDQETGLMTIAVTAGEPVLASALAQSFLKHFTDRVRSIRTEKVRERLKFVEQRFREAEQELETAEERLAQFLERNQNPTTATLQFQRDRLQRQVSFKEQLYSELQSQLTQTRLDLQRRQPVLTIVEEPVPPIKRSAPNRTLIVIIFFILGSFVGISAALLKSYISGARKNAERGEKIEELRRRLVPSIASPEES